jgi:hypothetical protein
MPAYYRLFVISFFVAAQGIAQTFDPAGHAMVTREVNGEQVILDTSATRWSGSGLYRVSLRSHLMPLQINQMHSWTVHVDDGQGAAIDEAAITVSGGMPEHNHGLPTAPRVTQNLGSGDYLLEGMRFNMSGWWELQLQITAGENSDTVIFNCILPE